MRTFDLKKWIFPLLGLLLLVAWFFLGYQQLLKTNGKLRSQLSYYQSETQKNIPEPQIQKMRQQCDSLQAILVQKRSRVFPEDDFQDLGKKIGQVVDTYGLKIVSIRPDYESLKTLGESREEIFELPFHLDLTGTFSQFTKWIDDMNALPFAIKLGEFSLERENAERSALLIGLKGAVLLGKTKQDGNENEKKPTDTKPNPTKTPSQTRTGV